MKIRAALHFFIVMLVTSYMASCEEGGPFEYSGVVTVKYLEYDQPKTISYEILSEENEITVKYHAMAVGLVLLDQFNDPAE